MTTTQTTPAAELPRFFHDSEVRAETVGGRPRLTGYAAKYNSMSRDLGGFYERIAPGAFDQALSAGNEILALVEHDHGRILARRSAGTLRLASDSIGLRFALDVPATTEGRDAVENVRAGNIRGASFRFPKGAVDSWQTVGGKEIRTLLQCGLREISLTSIPAYENTDVELRNRSAAGAYYQARLDELEHYRRHPKSAERRRRLMLLQMELGF